MICSYGTEKVHTIIGSATGRDGVGRGVEEVERGREVMKTGVR